MLSNRSSSFTSYLVICLTFLSATFLRAQGSGLDSDAGQGTNHVWRFSADNKAYTVQTVDGHFLIHSVGSGKFDADLPIKVDKKGRESIMGQWHIGSEEGFLIIQDQQPNFISGTVLFSRNRLQPYACTTRTQAVIANMAAPAGQLVCATQRITWVREETAPAEAAQREVSTLAAAPVQNYEEKRSLVDQSLIGTWQRDTASGYTTSHIVISLNPDGSYEKSFSARANGTGGWGGDERGTWTSNGSMVFTSGDQTHSRYQLDMRTFRRIR